MEIDHKLLIDKYYTALMLYLVYTFADKLLQGLISKICCLDLWIYTILWASLVIQTTFAYKHIMAIKKEAYTTWALVSDCIDISFSLFICAVISSTFRSGDYKELDNYILLYIPFMLMAINQFVWYVIVREFNSRALFQLLMFFLGILTVMVSECLCHGFWNLIFLVSWHVFWMAVFRWKCKAPKSFTKAIKPIWNDMIDHPFVKKIFRKKHNKPFQFVRSSE